MKYCYALMSVDCGHHYGKEPNKNIKVAIRFDSEDIFQEEADNFYDNVYGSINHALLDIGCWFADDMPECDKFISKEDYLECPCNIVFDPDL